MDSWITWTDYKIVLDQVAILDYQLGHCILDLFAIWFNIWQNLKEIQSLKFDIQSDQMNAVFQCRICDLIFDFYQG